MGLLKHYILWKLTKDIVRKYRLLELRIWSIIIGSNAEIFVCQSFLKFSSM